MSVVFRLTAPRAAFVAGEDILLGLSLENRGGAPLAVPDPEANANWQPSYALKGPGPGDVRAFDLHAVVRRRKAGVPSDDQAVLLMLAPGATWQGSLPLTDLVPLPRPGAYTLSARLSWGGIDVVADPVAFTVEPLRVTGASVGLGRDAAGTPEIFAAWMHDTGGGAAIFQGQFVEQRPDLGETVRRGVVRLCEPPAGARDVTSPAADHSRFEDLFGWVAWREGRDLRALPTTGVDAGRLTLGFDPALVLQPALFARSHDLEIFVVGRGASQGQTLSLIRFQDRGYAAPPEGAVMWTIPLPAPALSGAVAREPGPGRARHVVLVASGPEATVVMHAIADGTKAPPKVTSIDLDDCTPLADAPPGLLANAKGGVRAGIFVAAAGDASRARLVELLLGPVDPLDRAAATASIPLAAGAVAARLGYYRHPGGGHRRDFVVLDGDGALHARGESGLRVARAAWDTSMPLSLLVLGQVSYLLEPSHAGGLGLEALE